MAGCASAAAQSESQPPARFEPRLGIDLMWVDNLDLAPSDQPQQQDYIAQVTPGLRWQQEGRRFQSYLDYQAQALFYDDDSDRNEVFHNAQLSADVTAIENWLVVGADGSYFQSIVAPEQPINESNLFNVGNTSDTAAGRIVPQLRHSFGGAQLDAYYALGFVDYRDEATAQGVQLDDSRNEDARVELSGANREALITWAASYNYERAEYDLALPFEYERADAELGLRLTQGLRLLGRYGIESQPFDFPADGGLEESSWSAGFSWRRGPNAELRVLVGERFFGTSYEASLRWQGRVLHVEMGYDELPTTQAQRVAMQDVQAPDPTLPVDPLGPGFGRPTADVYLLKTFHLQLGAVGRVTRVGLDVTDENREYVQLGGIEDKVLSGRLFVARRFGKSTEGELSARLTDADLRVNESYRDALYQLRLSRQLGPRTTMNATGTYLHRTGNPLEYDATWVSAGVLMTF